MSSSPETTWLQERKLSYNKIGQPLNGLLNLILLFVVGEIFWYVLFSPNGVFQLYTPKRVQGRRLEAWHVAQANAIGLMAFILLLYLEETSIIR